MLACPHSLTFIRPVSALEQDVAHRLAPVAAPTLVGVGLVDGVEVGPEAILPVRICVITELTALCAPACVVSTLFPAGHRA